MTDQEEVNFSISIALSPTGHRSIQTAYVMHNLSVALAEFNTMTITSLKKKKKIP